jgi:hypothetical protein
MMNHLKACLQTQRRVGSPRVSKGFTGPSLTVGLLTQPQFPEFADTLLAAFRWVNNLPLINTATRRGEEGGSKSMNCFNSFSPPLLIPKLVVRCAVSIEMDICVGRKTVKTVTGCALRFSPRSIAVLMRRSRSHRFKAA